MHHLVQLCDAKWSGTERSITEPWAGAVSRSGARRRTWRDTAERGGGRRGRDVGAGTWCLEGKRACEDGTRAALVMSLPGSHSAFALLLRNLKVTVTSSLTAPSRWLEARLLALLFARAWAVIG